MLNRVYNTLPWFVRPVARKALYGIKKLRFHKIKADCDGMLPAEVYRFCYECACGLESGNVLEIGAAHGAGTVSMALGLQHSNHPGTVIAVEKGEGGSMAKYGSKEYNLTILRNNLSKYNLRDRVTIVSERLTRGEDLPDELKNNAPYSLLLLDADGWIDRDIQLLYEHLIPGALVLFDDYSPKHPQDSSSSKFYKTFWLVNSLIEKGYLSRYKAFRPEIGHKASVLIAAKPPSSPEFNPEDLSEIKEHLKSVSHNYQDREDWIADQTPILEQD